MIRWFCDHIWPTKHLITLLPPRSRSYRSFHAKLNQTLFDNLWFDFHNGKPIRNHNNNGTIVTYFDRQTYKQFRIGGGGSFVCDWVSMKPKNGSFRFAIYDCYFFAPFERESIPFSLIKLQRESRNVSFIFRIKRGESVTGMLLLMEFRIGFSLVSFFFFGKSCKNSINAHRWWLLLYFMLGSLDYRCLFLHAVCSM